MCPASTTVSASEEMEWMWKSNPDPWDSTQFPEWRFYSCIESMIIESAYQANQTYVTLDDYHVNFSEMAQISNNDITKRRPVKRVVKNVALCDKKIEKRFQSTLLLVNASVVQRPGAFGDFIWEAYLLGQWRQVPKDILVKKAAEGIIAEGKKIGRQREAEKIAELLLEVKDGTRQQIWQCCTYLYSLDSFLYKTLNATLRLVNSEEYKQLWRNRLETLGLFAWFLFDYPLDGNEFEGIVYRGANFGVEQLAQWKIALEKGELLAFPTFTSTSRNRSKAENFGNTLLIISVARSRETSVDTSAFSQYPEKEKQLLIAGFLYKVTHIDFDVAKKKHLIYLQDCNDQTEI